MITRTYKYPADGTKISAMNGAGEGKEYRGTFVYDRHSAEGSGWTELGSIRSVVLLGEDYTGTAALVEQNGYYPFGTRIAGAAGAAADSLEYANRYRFCGKEEQDFSPSLNLKLLDFGARYYDPFTCRWTTQDPLAEKYYGLSPYNYCANNPVRLFDPFGMEFTDEAWGFVNKLIAEIDKRQERNTRLMARKQAEMASSTVSANKRNRLQKQIQRLENNIADLEKVRTEIDVLSVSDQTYDIRRDNALNINGGMPEIGENRSGSVYNTNNDHFEIILGDWSLGSLAHELKHAYQFETGCFSSGRNRNGVPFYDRTDEMEAYQQGALFNGPSINILPTLYDNLQKGPMDANKLPPVILDSPVELQKLANRTKSVFRVNGITYVGR